MATLEQSSPSPKIVKGSRDEANALFRQGKHAQALNSYRMLLANGVEDQNTHIALMNNITLALLKLQQWEEARRCASEVLKLEGRNLKGLYRRATALRHLHRLSEAQRDATEALEVLSSNDCMERSRILDLLRQITAEAAAQREKECDTLDPQASMDCLERFCEGGVACRAATQALQRLTQLMMEHEKRGLLLRRQAAAVAVQAFSRTAFDQGGSGAVVARLSEEHLAFHSSFWRFVLTLLADPTGCLEFSNDFESRSTDENKLGTTRSLKDDRVSRSVTKHFHQPLAAGSKEEAEAVRQVATQITSKPQWDLLSPLLRAYVREGVRDYQLRQAGSQSPPQMRGYCAQALFGCLRRLIKSGVDVAGEAGDLQSLCTGAALNSSTFLSLVAVGVQATDSATVQHAALQTLCTAADAQRRRGMRAKALRQSQDLMIILESCIQLLVPEPDVILGMGQSLRVSAEFALASLFILLSDKERAERDSVDISSVADQLITPYLTFLPGDAGDESKTLTGLLALSTLWLANRGAVRDVLLQPVAGPKSSSILSKVVDMVVLPSSSVGAELRETAADLLVQSVEMRELRQPLLDELAAIPLLIDACESSEVKPASLLQMKMAATLAQLCLHDEGTRNDVFTEWNFLEVASAIIERFHWQEGIQNKCGKRIEAEIVKHFLQVILCLTIHGDFKERLLKPVSNGETKCPLLVSHLADLLDQAGARIPEILSRDSRTLSTDASDAFGAFAAAPFFFASIICNLLRSREDRERRQRHKHRWQQQGATAPELQDDEIEALEQFFLKLPEHSRPAENAKYDRGSAEVARQIGKILVQKKMVAHLSALILSPAVHATLNTVAAATEAISLFAQNPEQCGIVVAERGIAALLAAADIFKEAGAAKVTRKSQLSQHSTPTAFSEELAQTRQALARISLGVHGRLLSYRELLDTTSELLNLLAHSYELYQYEAALGLTNILSFSSEAREKAYTGGGMRLFFDLATSENAMCRAAGLECLCNMAMCDAWQADAAAGKRPRMELELLLAFLGETENERAQCATAGCLAMLSSGYPEIAAVFAAFPNVRNLEKTLQQSEVAKTKPALVLRVVATLDNLYTGVTMLCAASRDESNGSTAVEHDRKGQKEASVVLEMTTKAIEVIDSEAYEDLRRSSDGQKAAEIIDRLRAKKIEHESLLQKWVQLGSVAANSPALR